MTELKLPALIQAMLEPSFYPHKCSDIKLIQTQMSFVFLTGDFAYKIKKPVNLGYLDYTSLEKREFFSHQELQLNKRLSPDAYLSVIPITKQEEKFVLGGEGKAIEYALKMRQLPQERMMDVLLRNNKVTEEMIGQVAQKVANFHQQAETSDKISKYGKLNIIRTNTKENFDQTQKYIGKSISKEQFHSIKKYTDNFIEKNASLFEHRVNTDRIRDCHGDLHSAHICFANGIYIYDCIEFNNRFRCCDVASEIAFLAMDMDYHNQPKLSNFFVNSYVGISRDRDLMRLLAFYKCYLAYVRGKVWSFKMDDPHISQNERDEALHKSMKYFALAQSYVKTSRAILIITTGLMGTGKSTLANALASRERMQIVSSDITRKQMAGIPLKKRYYEEFDRGIYSSASSRKTYQQMLDWAQNALSQRQSVVIDASFKKREERRKAKDLAKENNAGFLVVECVLDDETIEKRLEQRINEGSISDGRMEILDQQKKDFDKINEFSPENHIVIDTSKSVEQAVNNIVKIIEKGK